MADNILRLKVESSEYDAKLKKAAEGIRHMADVAHKGGGELTGLEKAELDYIKALGEMETKSRSASGQVRELSSTYKELKVIYDQLNEVEKADEGGKALAAGLETLKQRAQAAKTQLDSATLSLQSNGEAGKGTSSIMEMLKEKFTVNIDAVKLFNIGLQAAEGALNVAKDAFFNNEEQLDEWGRIVESSHSLYSGFLNALNTGDISGYLNNISQIVQAARDAYDALDELGTYNAFNQINVERTRTNMTESIADFRGGKGSKDSVRAAGEAYKKELQDRKRLENEAYLAAVKRMAAERGVSAKDLTDALSGTYGHYQDLKNVQPTGVRQTVVGAGMFARVGTETFAQTRQEKLGEALRHLNDTELQSLQALGAQAQRTGNEIAQVDKQLTRVLNGRQPGESGGSGGRGTTTGGKKQDLTELQKNQQTINTLTQEYVRLGDESTEAARKRQEEIQKEIQLLEKRNGLLGLRAEQAHGRWSLPLDTNQTTGLAKDGLQLSNPFASDDKASSLKLQLDDKAMSTVTKQIDKQLKKQQESPKEVKLTDVMGQMGSGISSIVSGIEALGIEIPQGMKDVLGGIQTVTTILSGIATIVAAIEVISTAKLLPFVGANGGVIKAAGGYRVPGRTFSGDMIPARLNAGETVLNQAQAGVIANALQDREFGGGSGTMQPYVDGEKIFLGMNNTSKRMGRGEIVTTGTLRRLGLI